MMKDVAKNKSNNRFIDENHEKLLDALEELEECLGPDWELDVFVSRVNQYIDDLESHFLHEETLLRGVGFTDLEVHALKHRGIALIMRKEVLEIGNQGDAIISDELFFFEPGRF